MEKSELENEMAIFISNINEADTLLDMDEIYDVIETTIKEENTDIDDIKNKYYKMTLDNDELEHISIAYNIGYQNLAINTLLSWIKEEIFHTMQINFDYITLREDDDLYVLFNNNKDQESDEKIKIKKNKHFKYIKKEDFFVNKKYADDYLEEKEIKNDNIILNYKLNPFLQYKINKFKNKFKMNKLNKDLNFKINGKQYTFSSNYIGEELINTKKEKKIYSKSNYFDKYKNRITDNNIKKLEESIKNKELNNKKFWDNYNKNKNIYKDKINSLFKDDPVIDFDKETFYKKYNGKHYSGIYKDIILELDELEKQYRNFKIIENYYNKLKEDINIKTVFKEENNKINALFTDYENNRVNEYKVLSEIGNLIVNNKLSKEEKKEINSLNENSRPARIIKQSKRIYLLKKEYVEIKNIALAGISNWLRDTSDDNFNILLSFFNMNNKEEDYEYFSDDEPSKQNSNVTRFVFT